jgi:ATP phosphoribosyltransferase
MADVNDGTIRLLLMRASDVPTYVSYGVADIGVSGADTLLEDHADLLEPLDLGLGRCRMVVAAPAAAADRGFNRPWVKVATKYPNITRQYFRRRGIEAVIVKLYGSVELACLAGLADLVVDLVSTGATLKANNLVEIETITHISSRLVVNRASLKSRCDEIDTLVGGIGAALNAQGAA